MKIILTGANGYIGMRLLPKLLDMGHTVVCAVRDEKRLSVDAKTRSKIDIVEIDFLDDPEKQKDRNDTSHTDPSTSGDTQRPDSS